MSEKTELVVKAEDIAIGALCVCAAYVIAPHVLTGVAMLVDAGSNFVERAKHGFKRQYAVIVTGEDGKDYQVGTIWK